MPERSSHIEKCKNNLKAYEFLNATKNFLDWKTTILFYSALHDVDAFFASLPIKYNEQHPKRHKVRNKLVAVHLNSIAPEYSLLYHYSVSARYKDEAINQRMVNNFYNWFSRIHSYINP